MIYCPFYELMLLVHGNASSPAPLQRREYPRLLIYRDEFDVLRYIVQIKQIGIDHDAFFICLDRLYMVFLLDGFVGCRNQ